MKNRQTNYLGVSEGVDDRPATADFIVHYWPQCLLKTIGIGWGEPNRQKAI
jgi:hypothetical protein